MTETALLPAADAALPEQRRQRGNAMPAPEGMAAPALQSPRVRRGSVPIAAAPPQEGAESDLRVLRTDDDLFEAQDDDDGDVVVTAPAMLHASLLFRAVWYGTMYDELHATLRIRPIDADGKVIPFAALQALQQRRVTLRGHAAYRT